MNGASDWELGEPRAYDDPPARSQGVYVGYPARLIGPALSFELGSLVEVRGRISTENWAPGRIIGVAVESILGDIVLTYVVTLLDDGYVERQVSTNRIRLVM